MALPKCSICAESPHYKMAAFYWSWRWPTGDRRAYVQLMDKDCAMTYFARVRDSFQDELKCLECTMPIDGNEYTRLWVTLFVPGRDRIDGAMDYHHRCFEKLEPLLIQGARRLPERSRDAGGGPPTRIPGSAWESWDSVGIDPVESN